MNQVKKLNCWGAELSDISVIKRLKNVEVLSLSVNSISTLADIQHCKNLQELYIRKNCIPDISEICYLRDLPRLKNLWLEENPCATGDPELYRWTVIRNIPQLQKLDNVNVASEEMAEAMRRGLDLEHPLDGGSSNQSAMLQKPAGGGRSPAPGPTMQEDDRRRGVNRNSYHEQHEQETHNYQTERRESVQSPSRRVSNAVWPAPAASEERQSNQPQNFTSQQHFQQQQQQQQHQQQQQQQYYDEYERQQHSSRHHSLSFDNGVGYLRNREPTPETESMRRMNIREREEHQRYESAHSARPGSQRHSFSGHGNGSHVTSPSGHVSGDYYRGQDTGRSMQEYYASQSRATTPGTEDPPATLAGPISLPLAAHGRQRSRSDLTPVREGSVLGQVGGRISRENSSLESSRSGRQSGGVTPAQEMAPPPSHPQYDHHSIVEEHYDSIHRNVDQQLEGAAQLVANRALSPQRPYPLRPKNRNSNVLSAILCLIKEIDGPSLEVVEMAVRCRMEELED